MTRVSTPVQEALRALTEDALRQSLPMTCQPPAPLAPFPYGDVVPLGFLLMALPEGSDASAELRRHLEAQRQGRLWAYHRDTLVTCTDSALVLQGVGGVDGVWALEQFADPGGGYHPQRYSDRADPGVMQVTPYNRHWCQPDYATSCLVDALRSEAYLPRKPETTRYLTAGFESRSGLYFANPYLVDWLLARSLGASDGPLGMRLADDVLASGNDDGTFGRYDVPMSTALAVLTLHALGVGGSRVVRAQEQLADLLEPDGWCPGGTPFYSSVVVPQDRFPAPALLRMAFGQPQGQFVWVGGAVHGVSLYHDQHRVISTAVTALALSKSADREQVSVSDAREPHPRYVAPNPLAYIAHHGLPPYMVTG